MNSFFFSSCYCLRRSWMFCPLSVFWRVSLSWWQRRRSEVGHLCCDQDWCQLQVFGVVSPGVTVTDRSPQMRCIVFSQNHWVSMCPTGGSRWPATPSFFPHFNLSPNSDRRCFTTWIENQHSDAWCRCDEEKLNLFHISMCDEEDPTDRSAVKLQFGKLVSADGQTPSPSFINPKWKEKGTKGEKLQRLTSHPSTCCTTTCPQTSAGFSPMLKRRHLSAKFILNHQKFKTKYLS